MGLLSFLGLESANAAVSLAKGVRAVITGKEPETEAERLKKQDVEIREIESQERTDVAQAGIEQAGIAADPNKKSYRNAVGWTCALGFMYIVANPFLNWIVAIINAIIQCVAYGEDMIFPGAPELDSGLILGTMVSMLGVVGSFRTIEKLRGMK